MKRFAYLLSLLYHDGLEEGGKTQQHADFGAIRQWRESSDVLRQRQSSGRRAPWQRGLVSQSGPRGSRAEQCAVQKLQGLRLRRRHCIAVSRMVACGS